MVVADAVVHLALVGMSCITHLVVGVQQFDYQAHLQI
jgi:hypothetical protein